MNSRYPHTVNTAATVKVFAKVLILIFLLALSRSCFLPHQARLHVPQLFGFTIFEQSFSKDSVAPVQSLGAACPLGAPLDIQQAIAHKELPKAKEISQKFCYGL